MNIKTKLGAESGKWHAQAGQEGEDLSGKSAPGKLQSSELASFAGGDPHNLRQHLQGLTGVLEVALGRMRHSEEGSSAGRPAGNQDGVVQLRFNPVQLSYPTLLGLFFACHDPTVGYEQASQLQRSTIYFHTPLQEQLARREIGRLVAERRYRGAILTELIAAGEFTVQGRGR